MPVEAGAIVQGGIGLIEGISGLVNKHKLKNEAKELEKNAPKYKIQKEFGEDVALTESDLVKGEIIGVVASVKHKGLELEAEPAFYVSSEQSSTFPIMNFVVRTQTDPEALLVPIQRELQSVDSRGVVFNVRPFEKFVGDAVAPRRFNLWLFSAFGFLALVLVATGVYAMINFAVVQRRREIGIRIALGAQKNSVMKLMFGEGAILISFGLVIGLLVSLLLTHWMQALLFGVSATDPRTYLIMTGVIVAVGFLACWIPVRQATRVDPISVLRCD